MIPNANEQASAKEIRGYKPLVPQEKALVSSYKEFQLVMCRECSRILKEKRWTASDPVKEIEIRIAKDITPADGVEIKDVFVEVDPEEIEKRKGFAILAVSGIYNGHELNQEYDVPYSVLFNLCDKCSKNNDLYYEGAIQLRAVTPEIYDATMQIIKSMSDRGVFANKVEPNGDGNYDIRLSNQRFIKTIALELQRRFGGSIQNDAKLFSYNKQTSKNIYRVNVTYTAVPFKKHDIITNVAGDLYSIDAINKTINARNLDTGLPKKFTAKELLEFKLIKSEKLTISKLKPTLTVLHPQTYQETHLIAVPGVDLPDTNAKFIKAVVVGSRIFYNAN